MTQLEHLIESSKRCQMIQMLLNSFWDQDYEEQGRRIDLIQELCSWNINSAFDLQAEMFSHLRVIITSSNFNQEGQ